MPRWLAWLAMALVIGPSGLLLAGLVHHIRAGNRTHACAYGLGMVCYGAVLFFGSAMVASRAVHGA